MIREDRELLAELGRLNSDVVPLAMKIMDESVTVTVEVGGGAMRVCGAVGGDGAAVGGASGQNESGG